MATLFTKYSNDLIGHAYQAQDISKLYYGEPKLLADGRYTMTGKNVAKGERIWLTGFYIPYNGGEDDMYQAFDVNNKKYFILTDHIRSGNWLFAKVSSPSYGYNDAVKMINNLIENHKTILENNLLCAGIISKMESKGVTVPVEYKKNLFALQKRLMLRDSQIKESIFLDSKETASPIGFSKYSPQLTGFMNDPGIGLAPVAIYIIVSVVITLLSAGILYLIFSKSYNESKTDIVYSADLTAALLKKLTPEEYQLLLKENAENADKIASAASGNSLKNTVIYLGIGFLGFTLIDKFLANRQK